MFTASSDDGGLQIQNYVLESSPLLNTDWSVVSTYDGISLVHTMTTGADGLLADNKYRFRIKAVNAYGSSEWSPTVDCLIASLPSAPGVPNKLQALST